MLFEGVPLEALPAAWQPAGDEDTVALTLTGSGALLYDKRKHTEESIQSAAANPDTLGAALGYGSQPRPLSERAVTLLDPNGREVLALTTSDDTAAQSTEALDKLRNAGDTILNEPAAVALTRRLANRQSEAALVRRSQAPRVSFSMPRTVRVHLEIARDPDSFQLGTPPSKAKDMPSIAQAYTLSTSPITIAEVTRLTPAEARQALSQGANAADIARRAALPPSTVRAYTVTTKNGQATIVHTSAGEVYIDSSSLASDVERSGGGAQVYQAAQTYAANNGLQFRADSIVSPKAQVRRISQMISSVLRHNSTRHLNPLFTFRDGATGLQKQEIPDWIPADDVGNLHKLLATEHDIVRTAARAVGIDFDSLTYDPLRDTIIDGHRQEPLTEATFESLAARLDPGASGIGEATFLRAIVTGSAIRSPLLSVPWKSQTDDVLHQGGADAAGSDLRLVRVAEDLFYSRPLQAGERGQAAGASGQSGSKAGVSTGRSAGITAAGAADAAKLLNQAV
ncbi:MAG: hypothetical protein KA004_06020, partial [Verrucomicrobiales bacterium]|nr:hypothetical protein [Verrucomicrobiales bacterium]